jgi:hypothetical protein
MHMSETPPPEVRLNPDGTLDEIVASGASVHLEQMAGNKWWLEVEAGGKRVSVWLTAKGKIGVYYEGFGLIGSHERTR